MPKFDPATPSYFLNPGHVSLPGPGTPVTNPSTLDEVGVIGETPPKTIDCVLKKVGEAQRAWAAHDCKSRARVLHQIATDMEAADMAEVAKLMTLETGKPYPESIGEIANIPPVFRYYAEMARNDAGKIAGSMQPGSFQYQTYEPYGVSVHIVPHNFPLLLGCWSIVASLAAGNGVILKPAIPGTLCALAFMRFFRPLPDGLLACLPGGAEVGKRLIDSPGSHAVAFTGSVSTGREVAVTAAKSMKPAIIEAGGNDPFIVSGRADIPVAAAAAVTAAFLQSGQVCTSAERFFVVDTVHDRFVEEFVERARCLRIGDGMGVAEIGPLISEETRQRVERLVEDAITKGAKVELGGKIPEGLETGWFYEPTILSGATGNMTVMNGEIFGPVAAVVRVRSFDEALKQANDTALGLGACIFTEHLEEAFKGVARLQAGTVWVNNPLVDNDALPFGGVKSSGLGRVLGHQGLNAFRQTKTVVMDPKAKVADWWYPYPDDWFYSDSKGAGRRHI